jgi:hypothetical protein
MYIYIYTHVYMYIYTNIYTYTYIYIYICIHIFFFQDICIYILIYLYTCIYLCIHIRIQIHIYTHIYNSYPSCLNFYRILHPKFHQTYRHPLYWGLVHGLRGLVHGLRGLVHGLGYGLRVRVLSLLCHIVSIFTYRHPLDCNNEENEETSVRGYIS